MFVVLFIKPDTIVDEFMSNIDSNTLMLMSICVTFFSIEISDINSKTKRNNVRKYYLNLYENKVVEIEKKLKIMKRKNNRAMSTWEIQEFISKLISN